MCQTNRKSLPEARSLLDRGHAPFSRYAEGIRAIKMAVDINSGVEFNKIIGFTSSIPEEGKSTTSTAFAILAAQANERVLLVDCDLRNPSLTGTCSRGDDWTSRGDLRKCFPGRRDLQGSGDQPGLFTGSLESPLANSSELLASDAMKNLFEELREQFDYVVVDLSPLVPIVDVRSALSFVDAYVLIIEWGRQALIRFNARFIQRKPYPIRSLVLC